MKNALLIAARELSAYARSPIGYVVAAVTLLGEGIYFYAFGLASTSLSAQVLMRYFEAASSGSMVMAALLAMRLLAGERENGTIVLYNTAPLREWEVVLGKFLAGLTFLVLLSLLGAYMPALILVNGKVSVGHILVGYAGVFLIGAASLAIALFASALAPNQILAALLAGALLVAFFLLHFVAPHIDPPLKDFVHGLAIYDVRQRPFMIGVLRLDGVVYNVALAYFFLLAATKTLEARRWR